MRYNRIIVTIVSIGCILLLVSSHQLWKMKLHSFENVSKTVHIPQTEVVQDKEMNEEKMEIDIETVKNSTKNMEEKIQNLLLNRLEEKEKVQLLIVGSNAMTDGDPGYGPLLKDALVETYGDFIETTLAPFDVTSKEFTEEKMDEIDWNKGYDLVLLEPFTLNNNGIIIIEDEHKHIEAMEEKVSKEVSDAVVILQPAYPIYNANFYLVQIRALEKFALTNGYPYINHWSVWPDTEDEALNALLNEDKTPNSEGAKLWASHLITYFTGQ